MQRIYCDRCCKEIDRSEEYFSTTAENYLSGSRKYYDFHIKCWKDMLHEEKA